MGTTPCVCSSPDDVMRSAAVQIGFSTLTDLVSRDGDAGLADIPGLLDQLDVPQIHALWPEARLNGE